MAITHQLQEAEPVEPHPVQSTPVLMVGLCQHQVDLAEAVAEVGHSEELVMADHQETWIL